jgi:hypothetical protein
MAVYVDAAIWHWAGRRWCHLLADDTDQLHRFAALLGITRASFQEPPKVATPHYDLTAFERSRALTLGAIPCDRQQMVIVKRRLQSQAEGSSKERRVVARRDRVHKRDLLDARKHPQNGEMRRQTSRP